MLLGHALPDLRREVISMRYLEVRTAKGRWVMHSYGPQKWGCLNKCGDFEAMRGFPQRILA
jgi:hypothetical protein